MPKRCPRGGEAPWLNVIGIVGDVRQYGFESAEQEDMYVLFRQLPRTSRSMSLLVHRASGGVVDLESVRRVVRDVDTQVPVEAASMEALLGRLMAERSLVLSGLGFFGLASLLLVALGVYGLMSFAAGARTREMAVRVAVGADSITIVRLMMVGALRVVVTGTAAGLVLAWVGTRPLGSLLVEVDPGDLPTSVAVVSVIVAVTVLAALGPSLRAARTDPLTALREDA